jgi:ubiquinone/menaquinone biosynthesis C-methylase UbiE
MDAAFDGPYVDESSRRGGDLRERSPMEDAGYLFDNAGGETPTRFAGLEGLWDESTIRYLSNLGVGTGWKCWEVGAGGGSIARWLAERVAPTGTVLATDLDLTRIPEGSPSNLAFVRHDVVHDPIPTGEYDLVHARLVLVHLPEREEVIRGLVGSLRPGGTVLIEDFDYVIQDGWVPTAPDDQLYRRVHRALQDLLHRRGADTRYARRLPQLLRSAGLTDVSVEGRLVLGHAARSGIDAMRANFLQTGDELVASGLVSQDDLARALDLLDGAEFPVLPLLVSAWGRRPD